jgi:hypothetical protein
MDCFSSQAGSDFLHISYWSLEDSSYQGYVKKAAGEDQQRESTRDPSSHDRVEDREASSDESINQA